MKNFIAVILCFFIISNHSLWAQWVQPTGPISGSVSCIFVSGNNVLAGIYDIGVCLSTDKGVNWKLVNNGLTDLTIYKIAICDSYYIVGTHAGAFRSSNIGANWELVSNGLNNNSVNSLAVIGNNIFAGTGGDGVYLSTNYGSNWTPVNNGLPPYLWLSSLTANGNNIYVGVPGGEWGVCISLLIMEQIGHSSACLLQVFLLLQSLETISLLVLLMMECLSLQIAVVPGYHQDHFLLP